MVFTTGRIEAVFRGIVRAAKKVVKEGLPLGRGEGLGLVHLALVLVENFQELQREEKVHFEDKHEVLM